MNVENNVPKVRFDGFNGEWKNTTLSDVVDVRNGKDYKHLGRGNVPVYGTSGYMLSVDSALSSDEDAIGIGRKGTIDKPYLLRAPFWTVDTLFYAVPRPNYNLDYFHCLFQKIDWQRHDESTGVPSLSKVAINNVPVLVTHEKEQNKIGDFFRKIDALINQHRQKQEKLIQLKDAMLEKMFPKAGERVPEIRFGGFSGEWEEKILGSDIADVVGGGTPSTLVSEFWDGDIDWYSPVEIGERVYAEGSKKRITELGLKSSSAKILPAGRTVLFTSRAGIGDMAILAKPGATNQGFQSLVVKDEYSPYFLYCAGRLIKEYALKQASGSTFLEISGKKLARMKLLVPSSDEQNAIGNYFQKLDALINQHQQQITKLNTIKQACLDKMFV
ncbi:restriction endonuclease subunit S [Salinivibrio kushneri]|uniref:restriction endonuclease subunit S n=1 Tax=Salinivibrio kushneri TaxID=1908198 RepID=UPI0022B49E9C|nr:restriction endonuclease subunit S [Salinivibrio kushneri]WBA18059.1 restriction endonuclease subunit S [Salinivibrio kushneri]